MSQALSGQKVATINPSQASSSHNSPDVEAPGTSSYVLPSHHPTLPWSPVIVITTARSPGGAWACPPLALPHPPPAPSLPPLLPDNPPSSSRVLACPPRERKYPPTYKSTQTIRCDPGRCLHVVSHTAVPQHSVNSVTKVCLESCLQAG